MELHSEDVARRATSYVSAQEGSCAVCAQIAFEKKHTGTIYSLVT
jgi:hypothetical protein